MKTLFTAVALFILFTATAQSHCQRDKIFTAGFNIETGKDAMPSPSFSFGISGIYGKGTIVDNFSAAIGTRYMKTEVGDKAKNDVMQAIPTATVMYRIRFNGSESKLLHAFAFTGSIDRTGFRQYDYRIYGAPDGRSFATVGGLVGWNNITGINIGFSVIGLF